MKTPALTIGRRVALGFAVLLILGIGLGAFAVWRMRTAAAGARFLREAVAPQAELTSQLSVASAAAQLAVRTYSLTGEAEPLDSAQKHLVVVAGILDACRKLVTEQPELETLHAGVGQAAAALAAYQAEFTATRENLVERDRLRDSLDEAAASFVKNAEDFIATQEKSLADEINAGSAPDKLEERRLKLSRANQILDLGNSVRIANFKSQARRDTEWIEKAMPLFDDMEQMRLKVVATTRQEVNLRHLAQLAVAAASYREGVAGLLKNQRAGVEIAVRRVKAANEFDAVMRDVLDRSIERTREYADASDRSLGAAVRLMLGGFGGEALAGLLIAFFIIRGVNRALTTTADGLGQGSLQIAAASGQVSSASQALAEGASEQAASLEEVSSSIEELTSMTKRNADNAANGKAAANLAREAAEAGREEMGRMQTAMDEIQRSSADIGKIIKTIDEIAFQTNILALNAAVEAARAGEAGAGFAVVADEVRSLAQRSALAAKETADRIADAIHRSGQGVQLSGRVSAGLAQILTRVREVDILVSEVATASHEQSEGLIQINTAVSQMDKVTQSNAANAEETASAAEELNAQSQELRNAAARLAALVGANAGLGSTGIRPESIAAAPARSRKSPPPHTQAKTARHEKEAGSFSD